MTGQPDRTAALGRWADGNREALDAVMPLIYEELRALAHRYLRREREGHTVQTTALVHEAYLRLIGQRSVAWENRAQFLGVAAQMMRRILVNYAVARQADKRGGPAPRVSLDDAGEIPGPSTDIDIVALHQSLERLQALDPRQAQLVELRYFGGVSVEETARILGVSPATVYREWATARLWLHRALTATAEGR